MCGRFTLKTPPELVAQQFRLAEVPVLNARYNIAPTNDVAAVRTTAEGALRTLSFLHWGFVPAWAKDPVVGNRMINARAETAATSPAFRQAFRQRRCLVVADGFYEWQRLGTGANASKQPFFFELNDGAPFAFAGLWEDWHDATGRTLTSCTLLTTTPNEVVRQVHDRMPVILPAEYYDRWLDPTLTDVPTVQALLRPFDPDAMHTYPVTPLVNNPRNDAPECLTPVAA